MQCPVCKPHGLETIELEAGPKAMHCDQCNGHWISHDNYATWLKVHGEVLPEKQFTEVEIDVEDVHAAKLCPDCGRILVKYRVGHGLSFFVEHCGGCGGVWLDGNEWDALQQKNLHDEVNKIFTTAWQSQVRDSDIASKLEQMYRNKFGEEAFEKILGIREWIHNHEQKQAILAFLSEDEPYTV